MRLAHVQHDAGRLDLHPRPVAGADRRRPTASATSRSRRSRSCSPSSTARSSRRSMPCSPKTSTWSGNPKRPRSSTVRPGHHRDGGDVGQLGDGVEHRRAAARRRRRGRRSAPARRRRRGRRAAAASSAAATAATAPDRRSRPSAAPCHVDRGREVGEEALGPPLHVAAAHDLAQPGHPGPALVAVHLDGGHDRLAQRLAVVRVDEHGVGQLVGGAGELRQHEHAVAVEAGRDVLLGDEVHAVAQRRHEHHVAGAVERRRARRAAATGTGSGSPGTRAGRARR